MTRNRNRKYVNEMNEFNNIETQSEWWWRAGGHRTEVKPTVAFFFSSWKGQTRRDSTDFLMRDLCKKCSCGCTCKQFIDYATMSHTHFPCLHLCNLFHSFMTPIYFYGLPSHSVSSSHTVLCQSVQSLPSHSLCVSQQQPPPRLPPPRGVTPTDRTNFLLIGPQEIAPRFNLLLDSHEDMWSTSAFLSLSVSLSSFLPHSGRRCEDERGTLHCTFSLPLSLESEIVCKKAETGAKLKG